MRPFIKLNSYKFTLIGIALGLFFILPHEVAAQITFIQKAETPSDQTLDQTAVSATFTNPPAPGHLLVAIVGGGYTEPVTPPSGWLIAIQQIGIPQIPSQTIFYKIAGAAESATVTFDYGPNDTDAPVGVHLYEYSGINTTNPLSGTGSASGSTDSDAGSPGFQASSGSTLPTTAPALLLAGFVGRPIDPPLVTSSGTFGSYTNSFIQRTQMPGGCDSTSGCYTFGGAERITSALGSYSTTATYNHPANLGATWSGQIAAFRSAAPTAAHATVSGRIKTSDGSTLSGATVTLSGTESRRTITDSNGNYSFDDLETGGFYTITPSRADYRFSPAALSLSIVGNRTDAVFTAEETSQTANPLDTELYFIRQHYLDFLNREPEAGGLEYWASQIENCNSDPSCLRQTRINVSAAFFIEQEFQQTGSFVYRLYKGALGRQVTYQEFSQDRGLVIGGANLDASKAAFVDAFVRRAEFKERYGNATDAESFVDALTEALRQASRVDLSGQRNTLLAKYNSGSEMNESRSLVLREAIENSAFKQAEYNSSFVLMEYFGYLRRDPDQGGFDFWLNVLNDKVQDNYRSMVCAFITSAEYQKRFSSIVTHHNTECNE